MATQLRAPALARWQLREYRQQGYLILRGVFVAEEIAAIASEAQTLIERRELIDANNLRCRWTDHVTDGQCLFDCFDPVIDIGPVCRWISGEERIMAPLRAIFDDQACLLKDKLIFKQPGAKGYALHQDYIGWPGFPESFTTVIVAIDPSDALNGATEVFAGYHQAGSLSPADGDYHELPADTVEVSRGAMLELQPGDMAIFNGFTPHRSAANLSPRWRRQLYLSYNSHGDGSQRESHYQTFHEWLRHKYAAHGKHHVYFR